ncbi:MAG: hypothetical protein M3342_12905 [Bacteroidota bacterium]|nr:hypothetical protein [Flavisolibacter sp.]MBD0295648.1 hypothetical protein [Flavisolibacter sp.]MBD0350801.1 hypothetical protein [Flavisolibacter sp.]MBD0375482.1 hypothetical protein [Flavisolibacter sp.]MDQ3844897.1 hypothetical protein [Bacteroidota bacterium]
MATFIVQISNYLNRKLKDLWNKGSVAKGSPLHFSKYESLGKKLIGLDAIKRRLLFVKQSEHKTSCCVIDLEEVQTCSVRISYNSIEAGALKKRKLEEYLNTICLAFRFKNGRKAIMLPFYETNADDIRDIPVLETKAKDWMNTLSKMLPFATKERA